MLIDKLQHQVAKDARILPVHSRPIKLTQLMPNHFDNWNIVAFDPAGPTMVFLGSAYSVTRRNTKKGIPVMKVMTMAFTNGDWV